MAIACKLFLFGELEFAR